MPIYELKCLNCNNVKELLVYNSNELKCPECGSTKVDKLISATSSISGKNSYTTYISGSSCCGTTPDKVKCEKPGSCCGNI